jgi:hypothetical protein
MGGHSAPVASAWVGHETGSPSHRHRLEIGTSTGEHASAAVCFSPDDLLLSACREARSYGAGAPRQVRRECPLTWTLLRMRLDR